VIVWRMKATISATPKMRSLVFESWPQLAVDPRAQREVLGLGHLVGGGDPRAERAGAVEALGARPLALGALEVARREVVGHREAATSPPAP
jgi:hypothetical protein